MKSASLVQALKDLANVSHAVVHFDDVKQVEGNEWYGRLFGLDSLVVKRVIGNDLSVGPIPTPGSD